MQEQTTDLAKRAALMALPWAGGFGVILIFTGLIPCCNLLAFPLGAAGLGYLTATRLALYPPPETKTNAAIAVGLAVGALATAAAVIASLITHGIGIGIVALFGATRGGLGPDLLVSSLGQGISLLLGLIVTLVGGSIFGVLFGTLGGYLAFDRQRPPTTYY